jgi:CTP:molybdopterin cytidylyltransferase MocA
VTTAATILAAGGGTRFGPSAKLRSDLRGHALVWWAVKGAADARLDELIVVTGSTPLDDVIPDHVTIVHNPAWAEGIATSLAVAVAHARNRGHEAVVVGLGDQPFIARETWTALARPFATPIAVATYEGRRGNPVRLAEEVWDLLPTTGDIGARSVIAERPDLVTEVACAGDPFDIDTQEDLARWS